LTPAVKLVVGVFELEKPYFNLNAANIFTRAGTLRSRGIEFSVAGPLARGLNLVLGGAWMNPLVSGEAVQLGRIGEVPVGLSRRLLKLDVDYSPPFLDAFSIDLSVGYSGSIAASLRTFAETNSQLFAPARTVFDVGARYKFELADHPALIRAQLENLTNVGGWEPTSSGGFRQFEPRSMSINLTIDF
jgi:iron complex outermembrane receptor protein